LAGSITSFLPFITILIEVFILHRSIPIWVYLAALLSVSGVIIIILSERSSEKQKEPASEENMISKSSQKKLFRGFTFAGIATICWAFGNIFIDIGLREAELILQLDSKLTITTFTIRYNFALIVLVLFSSSKYLYQKKLKKNKSQDVIVEEKEPIHKSKMVWVLAIFAGIFAISLGTYFYGEATRTVGPTVVSILTTAFPIFIYPINFIINKEKISLGSAFGCLVTISGVILLFIF
jgi:drug/metabolite transporter (DMT)-like permease